MNLKQKTKVKKWRHSNPLNGVPVKKYGNVVFNEDTYIYSTCVIFNQLKS